MENESPASPPGSSNLQGIVFFQTERFSDALNRMAKICYGLCWRYHVPYDLASRVCNLSLASFCLFMGVAHSEELNELIKGAMQGGFDVYYSKTGREREQPMGEEALKFEQVESKRT